MMMNDDAGKLHAFLGAIDLGEFRIGKEPSTRRFVRMPRQLADGSLFWLEEVDGKRELFYLKPAGEGETEECRRLYEAAIKAKSMMSELSVSNFDINEILEQLPANAVAAIKTGDPVAAMKSLIREGGFRVQKANDLANELVEQLRADS